MRLDFLDWAVLFAYFLFLIYIVISLSRQRAGGNESFLLDGRRLTLPSFVATTVSTWYGGILGVGEYTFKYGISNWLVFGIPYYLAALIFALFIAKRASKSSMLSIPDQLNKCYDGRVAVGGAIYVFVMTVPAAYLLMMGILFNLILGWSLPTCIIIATIISTIYVLIGGFRSIVKTDWIQFLIMFAAFVVMVSILVAKMGGLSFLIKNLPDSHFMWHGGATVGYVLSWYFIALSTLIEPAFYQRCFAAKSPQTARRGILISIGFWILFDFLTTTTGMYARAILDDGIKGVNAFPFLADMVLPAGIKGLFLVGLLTTIMSTVDSYSLLAASTLGRDVLWRIKRIKRWVNEVTLTRIGLIFSGILAVGIALSLDSVVEIWHKMGSLGTPGLLLPMALSYSSRLRFRVSFALMNLIIIPVVVGFWQIMQGLQVSEVFPLTIQPIFIGLFLSVLILCVDHLSRNRKHK